jgi:hypothetical protein
MLWRVAVHSRVASYPPRPYPKPNARPRPRQDCECLALEFLPTVGLAMVVNLRRGYPDTVLAENFLLHCCNPLVATLGGSVAVGL